MTSNTHFAKTIKQLRKSLGLSQQEFGARIGVAKTTICNYEKGVSTPTRHTLENISIEFGIEPSFFINNPAELNKRVVQPVFGNVIPLFESNDTDSLTGNSPLSIVHSIAIPLQPAYINDNCIATAVSDNSMNKLGVRIGTLVVINKDTPIHNNDIIAVIYNGKLSLRRYVETAQGKFICTESTKMPASLSREGINKCDAVIGKVIKFITDAKYM